MKRLIYDAYEYLESIVESLSESVIIIDLDNIIKKVNPSTTALLHCSEEELLGKDIKTILEDTIDIATLAEKASIETTCLSKNGRKIPVLFSSSPLHDSNAKKVGIVCLARDITERKQAEEALRQSRQRYRALVENISDWVWEVDQNGIYTYASPQVKNILGYEPEEIVGKTPFDLMPAAEAEKIRAEFIHYLKNKEPLIRLENINLHKKGQQVVLETSGVPILNDQGEVVGYRGVDRDITERKQAEAQLYQMAHFDSLTGLPNRTLFQNHLKAALARAKRYQKVVALMYMDLDRFKNVNDTLGHPMGDKLLKQVAKRLAGELRGEDVVSRLGGDEFAILQTDQPAVNGTSALAERIVKTISLPYSINGHEIRITTSIGIAFHTPDQPVGQLDLLAQADRALYQAKDKGRNCFHYHDQEIERKLRAYVALFNDLHRALERQEFLVFYQPQVDIPSGRIIGLEALLRWRHPKLGLLDPSEFILAAEDSGLIIPLGRWILREALRQMKAWRKQGLARGIYVAVNLSPIQVNAPEIDLVIQETLNEVGLPPECLELEITENVFMDGSKETTRILGHVQEYGTKISIDDFGTGYSSLKYIKKLPIYKIKIAQEFVLNLPDDPEDAAIVRAVLALARQLNLTVIAEGVETQEQLAFLLAEGCTKAQGYYFARPQPAEELAPLLAKGSIEA